MFSFEIIFSKLKMDKDNNSYESTPPHFEVTHYRTSLTFKDGAVIRIVNQYLGCLFSISEGIFSFNIPSGTPETVPVEEVVFYSDPSFTDKVTLHSIFDIYFTGRRGAGYLVDRLGDESTIYHFMELGKVIKPFERLKAPVNFDKILDLGSVLAVTEDHSKLFVNLGSQVLIYFDPKHDQYSFSAKIDHLTSIVSHFDLLSNSHILLAMNSMKLVVYEIDKYSGLRQLKTVDMCVPSTEQISSLALDPYKRFVCLTCHRSDDHSRTNLLLFQILENGGVEYIDEINYYLEKSETSAANKFQGVSLALAQDGLPFIVAFEKEGDHKMFPYWFDGKDLLCFKSQKVQSEKVVNCSVFQDEVWTIDGNGTLMRMIKI